MTTATHSAARRLLRDSEHHRRARAKMKAEHPPKLTYMKSSEGEYTVPEILYPDGMPATIVRDDRRRTWYAARNAEQHHYTRAAAAHAEYQRAREQHRRADELQLTARKIRDAAEDWAQSTTEYRHAHEPYVKAIYAQSADLTERRGIANYWQEVNQADKKIMADIYEIAGVHKDRVHRIMLLAEARYVQQHHPEDYKQIEGKIASWRTQL